MSDHLPDDVRLWPRDPSQILGVTLPCDPAIVRKAYTRLIRKFKPEQFPEHFRLIREAYDVLKRDAVFWSYAHPPAQATPEQPDDEQASNETAAPLPVPDVPTLPIPSQLDPLQLLWDKACAGADEEAYRGLRELYDINPQQAELAARLYALLLANPDMDHVRTPCDWLVRGLQHEGPWGCCRTLYRREIDDNPEEVLSDRFQRLLDNEPQVFNLAEFLAWRWEAAQRLDRLDVIADDLSGFGRRLERESEDLYVRILLRAADFLAWRRSRDFDEICRHIDGHVHVHIALGEEISRLDFLREMSVSWRNFGSDELDWLPLAKAAPLAWTSPFENRHRILQYCRPIAERPDEFLHHLDDFFQQMPLVAVHLAQTIGWLWPMPAEPRDERTLAAAVRDGLGGIDLPLSEGSYRMYRKHLQRFCLSESIAPETVAHLLNPDGASFFFQRIDADWPLRLLCLVHRLIWM
ncbi:MAG TPA: J domain-containing protein [Gemmataceae bacterium]|nr:J domain-containing protein [Gemmataceae bacterium]